jgi:hypothetical protein
MPDEEANISKVLYLTGRYVRICGGHKRESGCALPGEASWHAVLCYCRREAAGCAVRSQPRP